MAKEHEPEYQQQLQVFPPGFSKLEKPLRDVKLKSGWIDERVAELKREHPAPVLPDGPNAPGGAGNRTTPNVAWLEIKKLELEKQNMTEAYFKGLEIELVDVDAALKDEIRAVVKHQFSTNQYKDQTREQLETHQKEKKPFDKGFDYMESLHFNRYTKPDVIITDPESDKGKQFYLNGADTVSTYHSKNYLESLHHSRLDPRLSDTQLELADAIRLDAEYKVIEEQILEGRDPYLQGENGKDDITPKAEEPDLDLE